MTTTAGEDDFPETLGRIEADIDEGLFTRGAQVCVSVGGKRVLDVAIGDAGVGEEVRPETLFKVYCSIKPVTAVAVARLVDAGEIGLDDRLGRWLPVERFAALERDDVSIRHLLTHTAGLHLLSGVAVEMATPERRERLARSAVRPPGWHVGKDAAYAEFLAWYLLGRVIEEITETPLREHLRAAVLEPYGLTDTFVGMTEAEYEANSPRIGVNFDLRGWKPFPMLVERTPASSTPTNCAFGGYTTGRDLAAFYDAVLGELSRGGTLATFCSTVRAPVFDQVLDRECAYGLGFMTELSGHQFGRYPSPSAFGHSGNVGSSFAFADPDHDLSAAVVFNGIVDADSAFVRRPALVRAVYRDLGLNE